MEATPTLDGLSTGFARLQAGTFESGYAYGSGP